MKKKKNIFIKILYILFIVYLILFIIEKTGYYEKTVNDKMLLTSKQIESFEKDVASNKAVNINDYITKPKDYSNFVTKTANFVNKRIGTLLNKHFNGVFDFFKTLFLG